MLGRIRGGEKEEPKFQLFERLKNVFETKKLSVASSCCDLSKLTFCHRMC